MTDIINTVLGLLFNKARDFASSELSEGDLTDEKFRKVIVREINDINKKLDALGKKDLLSSMQFLKEGLNRLGKAMQKKSMKSNIPTTTRNVEGASTSQQLVNEAFTIPNALAKKFEVVSLKRLENAKKSFKESRKEATRAFANEALSIDDRIMATELRIISRILESFLDDPDAGGSDCLLYLEDLHSLPAVREMYSVHVGGGFISYLKSFFNQEERNEKVGTVRSVNAAVLDFIAGFTTKIFCYGVNWPTIQLRNDEEYTLHPKKAIAEKRAEMNECRRMEAKWPDIEISTTLNTQKLIELVKIVMIQDKIKNFRASVFTGAKTEYTASHAELLETYLSSFVVFIAEVKNPLCLATDASGGAYVLTYVCESPNSALIFTIFVYDSNKWLSKCITTDLSCCSDRVSDSSRIGVFAMQVHQYKIAVLRDQFNCRRVNLIDIYTGKTYHTIFLPPQPRAFDSPFKPCINILNDSEVMVTRSDDKAVYIYTNKGQLKQTIYLPLEKKAYVCDIAYRTSSEEVLILTSVSQNNESPEEESYEQLSPKELLAYRLLVYSASGTLKDSYYLSKDSIKDEPRFINCSDGRVELVGKFGFQIRV